jgi:hypothetical protein
MHTPRSWYSSLSPSFYKHFEAYVNTIEGKTLFSGSEDLTVKWIDLRSFKMKNMRWNIGKGNCCK